MSQFINSNTSIDGNAYLYICDSSSGNIEITLPEIQYDDFTIYFCKSNSINSVKLLPFETQKINGEDYIYLNHNSGTSISSFNNNWYISGGHM